MKPFFFCIKDFYLYFLRVQHTGDKSAHAAGTDDGYLLQFGVIPFLQIFTELVNISGKTDKIRIVIRLQAVITMGNDHPLPPEYHGSNNGFWHIKIFQHNIGQGGFFLYLSFKQAHLPVGKVFNI